MLPRFSFSGGSQPIRPDLPLCALRRGLTLVAIAMPLFTSAVHAQRGMPAASGRAFHVGLGGGVSVPAGDLDRALESGWNGRGFISWQPLGMPVGVRATFGVEQFDLKPVTPGLPAEGTGQIVSGLANLTFGIPLGPMRPYITAGLGAFRMDADTPAGSELQSQTHFGIDGGAGLELRLGPLSAFVEGRIANVFTEQGLNSSLSTAESFSAQTIPITFGLVY